VAQQESCATIPADPNNAALPGPFSPCRAGWQQGEPFAIRRGLRVRHSGSGYAIVPAGCAWSGFAFAFCEYGKGAPWARRLGSVSPSEANVASSLVPIMSRQARVGIGYNALDESASSAGERRADRATEILKHVSDFRRARWPFATRMHGPSCPLLVESGFCSARQKANGLMLLQDGTCNAA
jgi:hypothetical protein